MEPLITVRDLAKRFDKVTALDGLDFDVHEGELFGFLGPNGAGKTTTINILTGLARPDRGTVHIAGIDCSGDAGAAQHLMGIVPDESNLYPELTGFENLCFCGALYGMPRASRRKRARELLDTFALADAADRKFAGYSRGMKRRLTIAAGVMHSPSILFLDEPTTGIDVTGARQIRKLIADLNASGTTVFLTTHYIEEAERLCRRVAFIVGGRIVRADTVADLMQPVQGRHVLDFTLTGDTTGIESDFRSAFPEAESVELHDDNLRVTSRETVHIGPMVHFFEEHGLEIGEARKIRPTLEEIFVRITGVASAAMKREKEKKGGGR